MDGTGKPGGSTGEDHDSGRIPSKILKRMEMQPPYCAGLHPEQLHKMPVRGKERGGLTMPQKFISGPGDNMYHCSTCGTEMVSQSDEIMGGRDDLYDCPVCKNGWREFSEDDPAFSENV